LPFFTSRKCFAVFILGGKLNQCYPGLPTPIVFHFCDVCFRFNNVTALKMLKLEFIYDFLLCINLID